MSRRKLLNGLALGAGTAAAAGATWPLAASIVQPLLTPAPKADAPWVEVAAEKELPADAPFKATLRAPVRDGFFTTLVELGGVWLFKAKDGKITALSATCPHLGCGVMQDGKGGFACPCHGSRFANDGSYVKGPAPRALDPLPVKVEDGRVLVQALQFATGTKQRRVI